MAARPLRKLHGNVVGAKARPLYVCLDCLIWYETKDQCNACGSLRLQRFASRAEAKRYGELRLLQEVGQVAGLKLQPRFGLHVIARYGGPARGQQIKIGTYVADFSYREITKHGGMSASKPMVEDVKGKADTHMSAWKRKHVEAEYGIKITIISRS